MPSKEFKVVLTRRCGQQTGSETVKKQIHKIISRALAGNRGNGWEHSVARSKPPYQDENKLWVFERSVTFKKTSGHMSKADKQFDVICRALIKSGQVSPFRQYPWMVSGKGIDHLYGELVDEGKVAPIASDKPTIRNTVKSFGTINTELGTHFNHIFGREHQIKIIHSALVAAKESEFHNRFHCVLEGPPGCGKSEILTAVGKMLGKENEAYMKLDATSTTEAGAQRILLESSYIPPVLIVEEIEKTDEKSLRWLLGILDHRAEIRKTNFHIGHKARNVKMLCLATVNDIELFERAMSGALYSRFAHEIHCPRPDRETMRLILNREVAKVSGKQEWIEPTLDFCEEINENDPRKIVPICLCGRDDLLNGSYQQALRETKKPNTSKRTKGA